MEKKKIRQRVKAQVLSLSTEEKAAQSCAVMARLRSAIADRQPHVVALFSPLNDEVQIAPLADLLAQDYRVVLPRVGDREDGTPEMEFFDYAPQAMASGAYGIIEPQGGEPCRAEEIDLMVVPGVAFTREGVRLGRGKGYYDRYLAREGFRAYTIGVCYACQLCDALPCGEYDRKVDIVVAGE
ncbi:MAG: 5-formyltetrahydrofolate cyclo-ligase [Alistipes sp.]|nr:5-formyltetrahydrofolate cyclo-ligase [Alistipes sp.]